MGNIGECVEGVILAAGLSSRAGVHKMALKIGNKTVLEKCIEGMYDLCSKVKIVGGYKIDNIVNIASSYPKVEVLYNRDYSKGMFSSVIFGLKNTTGNRVFITPGDYPFIEQDTYKHLMNEIAGIVIPQYQKQLGHPVLICREMIDKLLNESRNSTLKQFIEVNGFKVVKVSDRGILLDIDTLDDYKAAIEYSRGVKW